MKTESELAVYKKTESNFTDYTQFEDTATRRLVEKNAFINNVKYTPEYKYPRFDSLTHEELQNEKRTIYEAVLELDASKNYSDADCAETELFARSLEVRLKKILFVEAARNLNNNAIVTSGTEVNRASFAKLNESLYGKLNTPYFLGIIATEKSRLNSFNPQSVVAAEIKSKLNQLIGGVDVGGEQEEVLLDKISMKKLHDFTNERYADILAVVPNTGDDVCYDVAECVEIINKALKAGGLDQYGWVAKENRTKARTATLKIDNTINLPINTRRTAKGLRKLIIHEQEVHVRRAENGRTTGLEPLIQGTAGYADIEEGLGVLLAFAVNDGFDDASFNATRNNYITAGLALGADGKPRDAREVYEILWRIITIQNTGDDSDVTDEILEKAKNKAYSHVENAYRGTQFWMKGVIYTKLKVYYEGLAKNADFFKKNIDNLDAAFKDIFIGKYDHTDPTETELVKSLISHK